MTTKTAETYAEVGIPINPFPGLRPFEFDESHLFFGRDGQSESLIEKLGRTHFLGVVGTSGSGKSSLVRAGLLPALLGGFMTSAGSDWRIAILRPGNDPIGKLAAAINARDVFGSEDEENKALQIAITEATLRRGNRGIVDTVRQNAMADKENLLVVVDQFEELFRFGREASRKSVDESKHYQNDAAAFVKLLLEAHSQREVNIYVVLTMRSDFLGDCSQFWDLPEAVNEGQYLIPRLTRDQLREAITAPIAVAGGGITPRLVSRLLNDIGDDQDQLPVMQHLLMRVWDEWKEKRLEVEINEGGESVRRPHKEVHEGVAIDLCCYEAVGGMAKALSRHADEAYEELSGSQRKLTEWIFKCLTEKGPDNREVRRPLIVSEICSVTEGSESEVMAVIEAFRKPGRSFLLPPADVKLGSESLIDISHESLIRNWKGESDKDEEKRLCEWVEDEARSARTYRRLAETAELHREGKAGLWGDPDLQVALDWQEKNKPNKEWSRRYYAGFETAIEFLKSSENQRVNDIAERERQHQAEIERAKRDLERAQALVEAEQRHAEAERQKGEERQRRLEEQGRAAFRLRCLIGALIVVSLLAFGAAWFAYSAYQKARAESVRANEQGTVNRQLLYVANMNLAQRASEVGDSSRVQMLLNTFLPYPGMAKSDEVRAFDWYYYWRHNYNGRLGIYAFGSVSSLSFSPDGKELAIVTEHGAGLFDMTTGEQSSDVPSDFSNSKSIAFSADGKLLAMGIRARDWTFDREASAALVILWDTSTQQEVRRFNGSTDTREDGFNTSTDSVSCLAFSPDGRILAGSVNYNVLLWDVGTGENLGTLKGHSDRVTSLAFSPEGTLASGSLDRTVKLWSTKTRQELATLKEHTDYVYSVAFSPDGKILASGSADRTARLWDVGAQRLVAQFAHSDQVKSVVFSPNGKTLACGIADKTAMLWDINTGKTIGAVKWHDGGVSAVAFSPDGRTLATGSDDYWVVLGDTGAGNESAASLTGHTDVVTSIAFSADGKILATGSKDQTIRLWDLAARQELTHQQLPGIVTSVTFSPDGKTLAFGIQDKTTRLWDANTGRELARLSGHTDAVWSVAFSPDSKRLATGSADNTIRLWDTGTGQELAMLKGHNGAIVSLMFSPDGNLLASGSLDHTRQGMDHIWQAGANEL